MDGVNLTVKIFEIDFGRHQVVLHHDDATALGVRAGDHVKVQVNGNNLTSTVEVSERMVDAGEVGVFLPLMQRHDLTQGDKLRILPAERPRSIQHIKRKMRGERLHRDAIYDVIRDTVDGTLGDVELAAWVTALEIHDMDMEEVEHLTRAMVKTGETLEFDNEMVFDKHSIGGVPGNKITLLIIPIIAAEGILIPKTSSRAVTGAAGTADVMEVFCNVRLNGPQIRDITRNVGGVMCWGGGVNLAPADDIIIRAEHPLAIDPPAQLLASVMAKKKAVGANKLIMDLPMGEGTKLPTREAASRMARQFIDLGERLDMQVECAITYGGQPVGKAVGCAVEANEALAALRGQDHAPKSLIEKSTAIAGIALEMAGVVSRGNGKTRAEEVLKSGRAFQKFKDIVEAQGGSVPKGDVPVGKHVATLNAVDGGYVSGIKNRAIVQIARTCGAPRDHGAGLIVHHKRGDKVEADEPLVTLYAESEYKLHEALNLTRMLQPVQVEGMLLQRIPDYREL